jgi:predicted acylesterase/phospholipase RssA
MMRTLMVASERKSREVELMADFYLRPPLERFRVDDFARIEEIAEAGYEYTRKEIQGWKENGRFPVLPLSDRPGGAAGLAHEHVEGGAE